MSATPIVGAHHRHKRLLSEVKSAAYIIQNVAPATTAPRLASGIAPITRRTCSNDQGDSRLSGGAACQGNTNVMIDADRDTRFQCQSIKHVVDNLTIRLGYNATHANKQRVKRFC